MARVWWVVTDGTFVITCPAWQSEDEVKARWGQLLGEPASGFVRVPGYVRPFEVNGRLADAPSREKSGGAS
jgi:hypothetical protein